jgi:rSAM/selenodomain-associated transferase 1
MHENETALVILARYPEAGKTKTRLARTIGNQTAADLYHAFLIDLAQRFAKQPYALHWAYTPAEMNYQAFVATLAPGDAQRMRCFAQQGADLGERLLHAFQHTHEQGFQRTILISSDSPHISLDIIKRAHQALDDADVVLGPADDGGYYLISMHSPHDVFSGIPMSTAVVAQRTIEAAQRQGLRVRLVDTLSDVDELPDLLRLTRLLAVDSSRAPATAAYIANMRSFDDHTTHSIRTHAATLDLH